VNELVTASISPWYTIPLSVGLLAFTFAVLPGVVLHLAVLIYPKDHLRRKEFTAELYTVPYRKRPFWVAGNLVRCVFEGVPIRVRSVRSRPKRAELSESELFQMALVYQERFEVVERQRLEYVKLYGWRAYFMPTHLRLLRSALYQDFRFSRISKAAIRDHRQ
jgi:hypothetical protein